MPTAKPEPTTSYDVERERCECGKPAWWYHAEHGSGPPLCKGCAVRKQQPSTFAVDPDRLRLALGDTLTRTVLRVGVGVSRDAIGPQVVDERFTVEAPLP